MDRIQDYEVNSPRWLSLEDFEGEMWKQIDGYERYHISNYGRVKSDRILIQMPNHIGYYHICLSKHNRKKTFLVHRLVAIYFIPNPKDLPFVNHKDENKQNNRFWNLEWCTPLYNTRYGTSIQRRAFKQRNRIDASSVVYQYDIDGNFIAYYPSLSEAARINKIPVTHISSVCNEGRSATAKGYIWSFDNSEEAIKHKVERAKNMPRANLEKPICRYTMDGEYVDTFASSVEAERVTGISQVTIRACCKHYRHQRSAGGFRWEYEDNPKRDELAKKKIRTTPQRRVICYTLDGKYVGEYKNCKDAARHLDVSPSMVSLVCSGKLKKCKGYTFRYIK